MQIKLSSGFKVLNKIFLGYTLEIIYNIYIAK